MSCEQEPTRGGNDVLPEGEEAPPPGVRAMAGVRWALVALMAIAAAAAWASWAGLGPRVARSTVQYQCPMHPAVLQDRPGSCPVCGMDLVVVSGRGPTASGAGAAAGETGHGEALHRAAAHGDAPSGQAPHGADAHGQAPAGAAASGDARRGEAGPPKAQGAAGGQGRFWCPMHPEVTSDDPEARCAKCGGMKLLPRDAGALERASLRAGPGAYWCPMHPEVTSDDASATCPKCGGMKLLPRPGAGGKPGGPVPGLVPIDVSAARTQLMGARTAQVTRREMAPVVRTVGFVSADESAIALVTARVTGWIQELRVGRTGQRVARGQVLATLYSPELTTAQQAYLTTARWSSGVQPGVAPTLEPAGGNVEARRRLELLGVAREDVVALARRGKPFEPMPIRSPVSGYVARRGALPGLYAQPGTELFQIVDLSRIWVLADVYEGDMGRVAAGQRARVLLPAYPGERFEARVGLVYPALSTDTRTLQVRIELENPDGRLRPGMYGDVEIELPAAEWLAVPAEAVVDTGDRQYVFVAREGGRFEPRTVRVGARADALVQVLEGLEEGERVVTTGAFLVDSESRLRAAIEGFTPVSREEEAAEREGTAGPNEPHRERR